MRELDEAVGRTAAALLAQGLVAGDRVASWMGKTLLACLLPLAAPGRAWSTCRSTRC